jgi:FdhE protein
LSALTLEEWLAGHPFLKPVAQFTARVDRAVEEIETPRAPVPAWEDYAADFGEGVPLLSSSAAAIDLTPAGGMVLALTGLLSSGPAPGPSIPGLAPLTAALRQDSDGSHSVASFLLGGDAVDLPSPGLLRYLGWASAARYLAPVVDAFARWRNEDQWQRRYCPTCASLPSMAQLVSEETGRVRWLSCGLCRTRWRYARTLCPFCEVNSHRASTVSVEGEGGLRIDYCESCKGYLKTYDGRGNEGVLLCDWTSLHLDVAAHDRGLSRKAVSLYDLGSLLPARP